MSNTHNTKFLEKAQKVHGDKYDYSKVEYVNSTTKVTIICPEHGPFDQTPVQHTFVKVGCNPSGCPECGRLRQLAANQSRALQAAAVFVDKAKAVHGDKYDYSKVEYVNSTTKVTIICPEHGPFDQTPSGHVSSKQGCPDCGLLKVNEKHERVIREAGATFVQRAKAVHGDKYDYSKVEYKKAHEVITIICPEHGPFDQTPAQHLQARGCPDCAVQGRARKLVNRSRSTLIERFRRIHGDKYDYSNVDYTRAVDHVEIVCPKHGRFSQVPYSHLSGRGCKVCSGVGPSSQEREIATILQQLDPTLQIETSNRSIIAPLELDIVLPEKKLAIEFNGTYWHHGGVKDKAYHQRKTLLCEEKGYQLIHIYDYLWKARREQVINMLKAKLGVYDRKVGARQCTVVEMTNKEVKGFIDANHVQGYTHATRSFGLMLDGELLTVMTFSKPRFTSREFDWELVRMCTLGGVLVMGGFTKLLSYFKERVMTEGQTLCSFAQLDWSLGQVYEKNGFSLVRVTTPGYVWSDPVNHDSIPRYMTQKKKLPKLLGPIYNDKETEVQNMERCGFVQVFNAGSRLYRLQT